MRLDDMYELLKCELGEDKFGNDYLHLYRTCRFQKKITIKLKLKKNIKT